MGTAVVKAKDFIREVQSRSNDLEAAADAEASLSIHLSVRVEVGITIWSFFTKRNQIRSAVGIHVLELVLENIGVIVGNSHADRDATTVICRTYVPAMRSLALQRWMIIAQRDTPNSRLGIAVVRRNTET